LISRISKTPCCYHHKPHRFSSAGDLPDLIRRPFTLVRLSQVLRSEIVPYRRRLLESLARSVRRSAFLKSLSILLGSGPRLFVKDGTVACLVVIFFSSLQGDLLAGSFLLFAGWGVFFPRVAFFSTLLTAALFVPNGVNSSERGLLVFFISLSLHPLILTAPKGAVPRTPSHYSKTVSSPVARESYSPFFLLVAMSSRRPAFSLICFSLRRMLD